MRVLYEILKRLFQKFLLTSNLCVCFYLLHFVSLLTIYPAAYCHAYIQV